MGLECRNSEDEIKHGVAINLTNNEMYKSTNMKTGNTYLEKSTLDLEHSYALPI